MRLQRWVSLSSELAAGFLSAPSSRRFVVSSIQKHVRPFSRSAASMAEEAKKLAAYAAVDNHIQVRAGLTHAFNCRVHGSLL